MAIIKVTMLHHWLDKVQSIVDTNQVRFAVNSNDHLGFIDLHYTSDEYISIEMSLDAWYALTVAGQEHLTTYAEMVK